MIDIRLIFIMNIFALITSQLLNVVNEIMQNTSNR